jgi:creatinine amidohydrolase
MAIYFREATWLAVRQCVERVGVAVLPLASLEQHGPHLPCGTDTFEINEIIRRALDRLPAEAPVCVCPTIEYNVVQWASPMASAGLAPLTLERSLLDICQALTDLGFRKILLVHGHGGIPCGQSALWQAMHEKRVALYVDYHPYAHCSERLQAICGEGGAHGGCAETSMMLVIRPDLVDLSKAVEGAKDLWGDDLPFRSLLEKGCYAIPTLKTTNQGVYGDATRASREIGNQVLDVLAEASATVMADLAAKPLPPGFLSCDRVPLPGD